MFMTEWDEQAYVENERRDSYEQGKQDGLEQGKQDGLEQGIQQGVQQGIQQGIQQAAAIMRGRDVPDDVIAAVLHEAEGQPTCS